MTKTKSHWFRMGYIEVQDKKLKFEIKKMSYNMFRSIGTQLIESHLIGTRSIESRISTKDQQT